MLLDLYRDTSGLRKKELADMSGGSEFKEFYSRLDDIKNYHRRHPYLTVEPMELEFVKYKPPADPSSGDSDKKNGKAKAESEEESLAFATEQDYEKLETMFSGEETLGRYLDLHTQHEEYVNLKEAEQIPYLRYIVEFYEFEKYPHKHKNLQYKEYVRNICEYLESFLARSNPLLDVQKLRREAITKFEQDWAAGKAKGWELTNDSDSQEYNELFCKACEKQFQTKATFDSHLGGRKHKKAVAKMETQGAEPKPERNGEPSKARSIAELEYI
ncbi:Pre-mRNA-splicing factor sap61, partial [Spiromyces aspiralis]